MSPRRAALALLLVVSCGTGTTPKAKPTAPAPTITKAHAQALAKAGTLRPADLPGWSVKANTTASASPSPGEPDIDIDREMALCLGDDAVDPFVSDPGLAFSNGQREIDSSVDVAATPALAARDATAFGSQATIDCLEKVLTGGVAASRIVLTGWHARRFAVPLSGAATFGIAADFRLTKDDFTTTISMRILGAAVGHAEISVGATGFGTLTAPVATLRTLLARAVARVRAAGP